jgi:hypothetical protein
MSGNPAPPPPAKHLQQKHRTPTQHKFSDV